MSNILVVGSVNMDLVLRVSHVPVAGESMLAHTYQNFPGGKGSNQAIACARLGGAVRMCGRVGEDDNGSFMRGVFADNKVGTDCLSSDREAPTGLAVIMLEDNGANRIIVCAGANERLSPDKAISALVPDTDILLLQLEIPDETVIAAVRHAAKLKIPVVMDAGPAKPFPLEKLGSLEILSPNETETHALTGILPDSRESLIAAAASLRRRCDIRHIVFKLGSKGAAHSIGNELTFYDPIKVTPVDTTAAGDAFTAALALEYAAHGDMEKAVTTANIAGGLAVTKLGAASSLPYRDDVLQYAK